MTTHKTLDNISVDATLVTLDTVQDNPHIDVGSQEPETNWNFGNLPFDGFDPKNIPTVNGQPIGGPIVEQNEDEEVGRIVGWNLPEFWLIEFPDGMIRISDPASFEAAYTEVED